MPAVLRSGSRGRSDDRAGDRRDAHARLAMRRARDAIADRLEAVAEHVEADGDVADAGRRERGGRLPHAQSFAPR